MDGVITTERLREILNRQQSSAIERWLQKNNVRYFLGPDGPFTTETLLHASVGFISGKEAEQENVWRDA